MQRSLQRIKQSIVYGVLALAISLAPALSLTGPRLVSADATTCTAPANSTYGPGVHHPTGSDAVTFAYDCASDTWANQYYTYHPATNSRVSNYSPDYSYDCTAGKWYMTEYDYLPGDGTYHKNRVATSRPGVPTGCPATPASPGPVGNSSGGSAGPADDTGSPNGITSTGAGSANSADSTGSVAYNGTNNNTVSMGNGISMQAGSGDANVRYNTSGGDARSGGAQSIATIANLLQTSSNVFGPDTATFTADINGNVNGDFMFDPTAVMNTGAGSANDTAANGNITVNQADNTQASITNAIDVGAATGDATVADNTRGGDATSGDASAIVNLMNLINSNVTAGKSFVGTININGNLNGDILLPQGMIDQLLASTGAGSSNTAADTLGLSAGATNNATDSIANNLTTTADTGDASVAGNTKGGNATSGDANTNVTLLNLTGCQVVGTNDLLVFVNVLGKWVGMIMNAPDGSNVASLGGGATSTCVDGSGNSATTAPQANAATTNTDLGITNNVHTHARSGDAIVAANTRGGNATSGNASAAVNILNVANSSLNLSNWFGILFINVFGDWTGSFGVNTSAGDPLALSGGDGAGGDTTVHTASSGSSGRLAAFVTHPEQQTATAASTDTPSTAILGAATAALHQTTQQAAGNPSPDAKSHASYVLPIIGFVAAGIILLIGERDRLFGKRK